MHWPNLTFSLRRSKKIFVFQVTFSKYFWLVGREKKFFCEKSLCYRFHTLPQKCWNYVDFLHTLRFLYHLTVLYDAGQSRKRYMFMFSRRNKSAIEKWMNSKCKIEWKHDKMIRPTGFCITKIQQKNNFGPKVRKTFLSQGVLPWVGRVTWNTNIIFLHLSETHPFVAAPDGAALKPQTT